jgi:hypothetical protein
VSESRDAAPKTFLAGRRAVVPHFLGLSPEDTLNEILFGLVMVLTFTLGAGIAAGGDADADGARALIVGAIGCNIAWGLIDAVFYVMGLVFVRSRRSRLLEGFRAATDKGAAIGMVREELEEQLAPITTSEDRGQLYERVYNALKKAPTYDVRIEGSDVKGAIGVFLLVSLTAVPAAIPFLFVSDPWQALRISNFILVGLIFFVGYRWAGYTRANPWKVGLALMLIGIILVVVAIALGG